MSNEKNIRVNFMLDEETYEKIREVAAQDDRSISSFIRLAILEAIKYVD